MYKIVNSIWNFYSDELTLSNAYVLSYPASMSLIAIFMCCYICVLYITNLQCNAHITYRERASFMSSTPFRASIIRHALCSVPVAWILVNSIWLAFWDVIEARLKSNFAKRVGLLYPLWLPIHFEILHRPRQCHCYELFKISTSWGIL